MWKFCWSECTSFACLIDTKHFTDKCEMKWTKTEPRRGTLSIQTAFLNSTRVFKRDIVSLVSGLLTNYPGLPGLLCFFSGIWLRLLPVEMLVFVFLVQTGCLDGYIMFHLWRKYNEMQNKIFVIMDPLMAWLGLSPNNGQATPSAITIQHTHHTLGLLTISHGYTILLTGHV